MFVRRYMSPHEVLNVGGLAEIVAYVFGKRTATWLFNTTRTFFHPRTLLRVKELVMPNAGGRDDIDVQLTLAVNCIKYVAAMSGNQRHDAKAEMRRILRNVPWTQDFKTEVFDKLFKEGAANLHPFELVYYKNPLLRTLSNNAYQQAQPGIEI